MIWMIAWAWKDPDEDTLTHFTDTVYPNEYGGMGITRVGEGLSACPHSLILENGGAPRPAFCTRRPAASTGRAVPEPGKVQARRKSEHKMHKNVSLQKHKLKVYAHPLQKNGKQDSLMLHAIPFQLKQEQRAKIQNPRTASKK